VAHSLQLGEALPELELESLRLLFPASTSALHDWLATAWHKADEALEAAVAEVVAALSAALPAGTAISAVSRKKALASVFKKVMRHEPVQTDAQPAAAAAAVAAADAAAAAAASAGGAGLDLFDILGIRIVLGAAAQAQPGGQQAAWLLDDGDDGSGDAPRAAQPARDGRADEVAADPEAAEAAAEAELCYRACDILHAAERPWRPLDGRYKVRAQAGAHPTLDAPAARSAGPPRCSRALILCAGCGLAPQHA
jgi:(p)ppGpp synthase/HD superfamily hydrolase